MDFLGFKFSKIQHKVLMINLRF